ncbi:hypothetical protein BBAD15_g4931 [Beauveria bassiana D1-5]|uniref:Uncharacterized protein n=1 Tax=Beauveria bassiana D1-5 TaxID=1245745 RepID=A0A0A2VUB1_BEABA|nr:hypothetical protein BBAD15_g4931 [Beauveria bassiana D1-5]
MSAHSNLPLSLFTTSPPPPPRPAQHPSPRPASQPKTMSTATTMQRVVLALTNFKSPILRTVVPCGLAAVALQALAAAPSVAARSELFLTSRAP